MPFAPAPRQPAGASSPHQPARTAATPAAPDQLYDEIQAARLLRVSRRTLQGWRLKGGGPLFVRLGPRCIRYRRADLQEFLAERTRRSTSEYDATR